MKRSYLVVLGLAMLIWLARRRLAPTVGVGSVLWQNPETGEWSQVDGINY